MNFVKDWLKKMKTSTSLVTIRILLSAMLLWLNPNGVYAQNDKAETFFSDAQTAFNRTQWETCVVLCDSASALQPGFTKSAQLRKTALDKWIQKADQFFNLSEHRDALIEYEKILRHEKSLVRLFENAAKCAHQIGEFERGFKLRREWAVLFPDDFEAQYQLAVFFVGQCRWPEAVTVLRRALELKPFHNEAKNHLKKSLLYSTRAQVWENLADSLRAAGDWREANVYLDSLIAMPCADFDFKKQQDTTNYRILKDDLDGALAESDVLRAMPLFSKFSDHSLRNQDEMIDYQNRVLDLFRNPPPSPVRIAEIQARDIFASQAGFHRRNPWLEVELRHEGEDVVFVTLTAEVNRYDLKTRELFVFHPDSGKTKTVTLRLESSDKFLKQRKEIRREVRASVRLESYSGKVHKTVEAFSPEFMVYGRGSVDWQNGVGPAAAFVLSEDRLVTQIADAAQMMYHAMADSVVINEKISLAALVFEILSRYGVRYKSDGGFAQRSVDIIQYPFELLQSRLGDCDDMTVLYASILENLGIETAMLDVPGHILLMFDTGIHDARRQRMILPNEQYVRYRDRIWLPVETTFLGKPFTEALAEGMRQYRHVRGREKSAVTETQKAWETWPPTPQVHNVSALSLPGAALMQPSFRFFREQTAGRQESFLQSFEERLRRTPCDPAVFSEYLKVLILGGKNESAKSLQKRWSRCKN